jgi:lipoprotein-anchoring transpeptidase ErfK/SrfK
MLPNGSVGWVLRKALGNLYTVRTHLYVDRERFTATLKRDGRTIFTARVGVGRPSTPTPRGQFYVRDELSGFGDPFYGPIVFGTNGRSAVLTEWPDGGFIGIHGTDRPGILPGAVSHGCIRMVNRDIRRLAKLMPIGTPLTIT